MQCSLELYFSKCLSISNTSNPFMLMIGAREKPVSRLKKTIQPTAPQQLVDYSSTDTDESAN